LIYLKVFATVTERALLKTLPLVAIALKQILKQNAEAKRFS
jgi:hypothetical protein